MRPNRFFCAPMGWIRGRRCPRTASVRGYLAEMLPRENSDQGLCGCGSRSRLEIPRTEAVGGHSGALQRRPSLLGYTALAARSYRPRCPVTLSAPRPSPLAARRRAQAASAAPRTVYMILPMCRLRAVRNGSPSHHIMSSIRVYGSFSSWLPARQSVPPARIIVRKETV